MKNRALALVGSLLLFSLFLLASCVSTKLTSSWQDAEYQGSVVDNVLVVGISDNLENRKLFEDALVKELQKNGVVAIASADAISAEKELDKDTIKAEAARLGMGAVMVTHVNSVAAESVYEPPPTGRAPYAYYGQLDTDLPAISQDIYRPGAYRSETLARLSTNLYDRETEKLIWTASSETVDPKSVKDVVGPLSKLLVKDLRDKKLIK